MPHITTPNEIKQLGTILCVGAHPDDETWIAGGIMAAASANGQRVVVVTATKGEVGQSSDESRWPTDRLGEIRAQELHNALRILGATEHTWLGCMDGECHCEDCDMMAARLAMVIREVNPDSILTFGPEGLTGHTDHQTVSMWCDVAIKTLDNPPVIYHAAHTPEWYEAYGRVFDEKANVYFNIDEPPLVPAEKLAIQLKLDDALCHKKLAALKAQPSQTERLLQILDEKGLPAALCEESFIIA